MFQNFSESSPLATQPSNWQLKMLLKNLVVTGAPVTPPCVFSLLRPRSPAFRSEYVCYKLDTDCHDCVTKFCCVSFIVYVLDLEWLDLEWVLGLSLVLNGF